MLTPRMKQCKSEKELISNYNKLVCNYFTKHWDRELVSGNATRRMILPRSQPPVCVDNKEDADGFLNFIRVVLVKEGEIMWTFVIIQ